MPPMSWEIESDDGYLDGCSLAALCDKTHGQFAEMFVHTAKRFGMYPDKPNCGRPETKHKPRWFKQPERIVRLYNAETALGKSIFAKKREQNQITPLYPLLGFPNNTLDGFEKFMN
jgi:hypothetical protein